MGNLQSLVLPPAIAFSVYWLARIASSFYAYYVSQVRHLPGPPRPSLIYGNEKELSMEGTVLLENWVKKYGPTIRFQSFVGMSKLYTTDLKAINHILMNSYTYQKPEFFRFRIEEIVGKGVVVVEGDTHKHQRRVMNPAFSASQIRELTSIFVDKSLELRDIWDAEIQNQGGMVGRIDVLAWLNKTALDVIGLAGFDYKFNALSDGENSAELNRAFTKVLEYLTRFSVVSFLRAAFPALRWLPTKGNDGVKEARKIMDDIGNQLVSTGKRAIQQDGVVNGSKSLRNKDLLTVLLRANMATDIPEHQRMSDQEILAQIPAFLSAGHETTSTATVWALYALGNAPETQRKLRDELLTAPSEDASMDELNSFPYLDSVVRETLRLYAPVPFTSRVAAKDDVLPLSTPVKDNLGRVHESIHIRKGQIILVPIVPVNENKAIWGEDSLQFRPERWESVPQAATAIPGVWGNSMAFLGGPRACIGYRFAVMEMKALLFTLIRAFEFEPAIPVEDIGKKFFVVQRPFLKSNPEAGTQMPLKVKLYQRM